MAARRAPRCQTSLLVAVALSLAPLVGACRKKAGAEIGAVASASAAPSVVPMTTAALASASAVPVGPTLASIQMQTWIYAEPRRGSAKLGYLRAGAIVARKEQPSGKEGCADGWYAIQPVGYVCIGEQATLDSNHPIVRATSHRRPDLLMPMPYRYGFIRSVAPQYLKVPTDTEQHDHEFKLDNHLKYYAKHATEWQIVDPGANDVPPEQRGKPVTVAPKHLGSEAKSKEVEKVSKDDDDNGGETVDFGDAGVAGGAAGAPGGKTSAQLSLLELFGADSGDETIPWWLQGPERQVPQLSSFVAPKYAVIAGRVKRHTGLAFIDAFHVGPAFGDRDLAVTTDLRLVPISKLKPNVGSQWHGVDLDDDFTLPIAFAHDFSKDGKGQIVPKSTPLYAIDGDAVKSAGALVFRQAVALSGKDRTVDGARYFETKDGKWLKKGDIIIARKPDEWPKDFAKGSQRWIDLSVLKQTLVLYEGERPVFATLVSTGQDGIGDPDTTKSTVRGTFRIREKHVTTTMDANEVENKFELRDVPWVQYFEKGYAMHAAYWHDEYGSPRSHGCVNLSPIDARRVFFWTGPELPAGWHAAYSNEATDKGTIVYSHI